MLKNKGFTLIELLVVMGIIGILAGIVLVSFGGSKEKARIADAQSQLQAIYKAILMLEVDTAEWPGGQTPWTIATGAAGVDNEICSDAPPDDCNFKLSDPEAGIMATDGSYLNWSGPYLSSLPKDPWGNDYFFDTDYDLDPAIGNQGLYGVVIGSYGPNGTGNGDYDNNDIIYVMVNP